MLELQLLTSISQTSTGLLMQIGVSSKPHPQQMVKYSSDYQLSVDQQQCAFHILLYCRLTEDRCSMGTVVESKVCFLFLILFKQLILSVRLLGFGHPKLIYFLDNQDASDYLFVQKFIYSKLFRPKLHFSFKYKNNNFTQSRLFKIITIMYLLQYQEI